MWRRVLILSIVPAIFLAVTIVRDVQTDGRVTFVRGAGELQRDVSEYYPQGRLGDAEYDGAMWMQKVLDEPVYFDVRLPRAMESITVRVHTTGDISGVKMGLRRLPTDTGEWNYDVQVPDSEVDGRYVVLTEEWLLHDALVENGKVRVLVSVPAGAEISLGTASIDLVGQRMGLVEVVKKIVSRFAI